MSIVLDSAIVAIDGTVIIITMVTAGIIAMRLEILDRSSADSLGKLILYILLPCLLFTEMIKNFEIRSMEMFGILFFFCTAHIAMGVAVGWVVGKLLRSKRDIRRLIMNCIGFQDTTAIPLVFATVLGYNSTIDGGADFENEAIEVVLVYTIFVTVYKWTVSYALMKPKLEGNVKPLNAATWTENELENKMNQSGICWTIKKILNPPIYSTLIAIPLALIPYCKEYVFTGSGAVLKGNLFKALILLGSTVSPLLNFLLGCNLSKGYPPNADISKGEIGAILLGKEFIMPVFGCLLVWLFRNAGLMNNVMSLMVLVIYAAPTSLQLLMICTVHKNQVDNISKVYLIMYVTSAIPIALWTMAFIIWLY